MQLVDFQSEDFLATATSTKTFATAPAVGDLLVLAVLCTDDVSVTAVADDTTDAWTTLLGTSAAGIRTRVKASYKVSHGDELSVSATLSGSGYYRSFLLWHFSPTGLNTVTWGTPHVTGGTGSTHFVNGASSGDPIVLSLAVHNTGTCLGGATNPVGIQVGLGYIEGPFPNWTGASGVPSNTYVDDSATIDLGGGFPSSGTGLNASKDNGAWAAHILAAVSEPAETLTFDGLAGTATIGSFFSRLIFPYTETTVTPTTGFVYNVTSRRVDARELPYEVSGEMLEQALIP